MRMQPLSVSFFDLLKVCDTGFENETQRAGIPKNVRAFTFFNSSLVPRSFTCVKLFSENFSFFLHAMIISAEAVNLRGNIPPFFVAKLGL